ncbi:hypothetical protein H4Q26_002072 [Puccinia striiformis f. sp. tritici PST-130]|nr:hypothetical protein H4Q26_002072 [Puccinia striiformis f. sp. tritici PST-130]
MEEPPINIEEPLLITMEEMDMFQQINAQSGMQEKETTHLNNVSLDQVNLKMGKTTYWVHNVNKLKDRITNRNSFKSHLSQYMKYSSTPTLEKPMDVADTVMDVADTVMDVADTVMDVADTVMDVADTVMDVADTVMDVADTVFGLMANTKDFEKRKMDVEDMKINLEDILIKDIGYVKMYRVPPRMIINALPNQLSTGFTMSTNSRRRSLTNTSSNHTHLYSNMFKFFVSLKNLNSKKPNGEQMKGI